MTRTPAHTQLLPSCQLLRWACVFLVSQDKGDTVDMSPHAAPESRMYFPWTLLLGVTVVSNARTCLIRSVNGFLESVSLGDPTHRGTTCPLSCVPSSWAVALSHELVLPLLTGQSESTSAIPLLLPGPSPGQREEQETVSCAGRHHVSVLTARVRGCC